MHRLIRTALLLTFLLQFISTAGAHYNMLLPAAASGKKGESVALVYQWGHPFEHQLFDAPMPQAVFVLTPDGKKIDLAKNLKVAPKTEDKKAPTSHRLTFTPEERGDYTFVLQTPPIWMEEEQEFFHDTVKVILHVQAQKGWDAVVGQGFEVVPLTRPYGLQPGMVFQVQALDGKPVLGALVEVERYNPIAPKELPADEHITRSMKTDPNGVATCTLTEPGWWCITAQRDGGKKEYKGKMYPVKQRATLWVFVDEKTK